MECCADGEGHIAQGKEKALDIRALKNKDELLWPIEVEQLFLLLLKDGEAQTGQLVAQRIQLRTGKLSGEKTAGLDARQGGCGQRNKLLFQHGGLLNAFALRMPRWNRSFAWFTARAWGLCRSAWPEPR